MTRGSEEEDDNNGSLNATFLSLVVPCKHAITKEKKVVVVALLPSAAKDVKINVTADESSA